MQWQSVDDAVIVVVGCGCIVTPQACVQMFRAVKVFGRSRRCRRCCIFISARSYTRRRRRSSRRRRCRRLVCRLSYSRSVHIGRHVRSVDSVLFGLDSMIKS